MYKLKSVTLKSKIFWNQTPLILSSVWCSNFNIGKWIPVTGVLFANFLFSTDIGSDNGRNAAKKGVSSHPANKAWFIWFWVNDLEAYIANIEQSLVSITEPF